MSFVSKVFGGDRAAKASREAADIQSESAKNAAAIQRQSNRDSILAAERAEERARGDLAPFKELGMQHMADYRQALDNRSQAVGTIAALADPQNQLEFIQENPFYNALASEAQTRLLNNQAARGKLGSGDTANALQESLLTLGSNLIQQEFNNRHNLAAQYGNLANDQFNAVAMGQNAAAGQGTATQNAANAIINSTSNTARNISDLTTSAGNAQAAGMVGAANAKNQALNTAINTGLGIGTLIQMSDIGKILKMSDKRVKENIEKVGRLDNGLAVYLFNYKNDATPQLGLIAQEVEQVNKNAVVEIDQIKYVDYMEAVKNGY